ncbi:MAG: ribosome biogenesis GTPase YlqF [Oscillospiraceae bacterium]|nr:ribosome biogenesis GTPase YlqF [Oscillospiraceae bacterium]
MHIQWYPGHMTKTRRQMEADLKQVDLVLELVDARIPISSRNPDIDALTEGKPHLIVLNRADQADSAMNRVWSAWFRGRGYAVLETNAREGKGVGRLTAVIEEVLQDKIARWKEKGLVGRPVRAMVVGIPNVGKSTFINQVAGRKSTKAGDRPGVTRGKQWVTVSSWLSLLDTPGILWPKFEDETVGLHLAFTGAIKDEVMDMEDLACRFLAIITARYPEAIAARYGLAPEEGEESWHLLERLAQKRGFLLSGGVPDTERMAKILLDEYRGGKLGNFTLEAPEGETKREDGV